MTIQSVTFISPTVIRVNLSFTARVDPEYLLTSNYAVALHAGSEITGEPITIAEVLVPANDPTVTHYVHLRTSKHTPGADYEISYQNLTDSEGNHAVAPDTFVTYIPYRARISKTMQMLKSLPGHFDIRETSLLRSLITAISLEDDAIGGSRNDSFPSSVELTAALGVYSLLLTESGFFLLTEDGNSIAKD